MEKINFEQAKQWIREKYSDDTICSMFDDEVYSGDWIDREQFEDEGYENEYDYYIDYGHGEAESVVINIVLKEIQSLFELDFDMYGEGVSLHRFMCEEYSCLISG